MHFKPHKIECAQCASRGIHPGSASGGTHLTRAEGRRQLDNLSHPELGGLCQTLEFILHAAMLSKFGNKDNDMVCVRQVSGEFPPALSQGEEQRAERCIERAKPHHVKFCRTRISRRAYDVHADELLYIHPKALCKFVHCVSSICRCHATLWEDNLAQL